MATSELAPVELAVRDGSRSHEIACLVLALLMHVPILSLGAWSWIAALFNDQSELNGDQDVEVPMALDLDSDTSSKPDKKDSKVEEVQVVPQGEEIVPVAVDAGPPRVDAAAPDAAARR